MKKHFSADRCPHCNKYPKMLRREPDLKPATWDQVRFSCCKIIATGFKRNDAVCVWNMKVADIKKGLASQAVEDVVATISEQPTGEPDVTA